MIVRNLLVDLLDNFNVKQIGSVNVSFKHVMLVDPLLVVSHGEYVDQWKSIKYGPEPFEVSIGNKGNSKGLCLPVSQHVVFGSSAPHFRIVTICEPNLRLGVESLVLPEQGLGVPTKVSRKSSGEWPKRYDGEKTIPL